MNKLVGKKVIITDKESWFYNEWGTIKEVDGDFYYVAIADGLDSVPVFNRDQFKVCKEKTKEARK